MTSGSGSVEAKLDERMALTQGQRGTLFRSGGLTCFIPAIFVSGTLRAPAIDVATRSPALVKGVALIRGAPTRVVDLGAALGTPGLDAWFVVLRVGARRLALAVDAVDGTRELDSACDRVPMLRAMSTQVIGAIGAIDAQLLAVLAASRILHGELRFRHESTGALPR